MVTIPPNDSAALKATLKNDSEIGCVILEPTGGHFGQVPIDRPFLTELRQITQECGVVLIFDEVVTGFRVSPGGAQGHFNIAPDLTIMAKVVAGGYPGACLGGRKDIIDLLEIGQPVDLKMPHPGTFNANPISAAAGVAARKLVRTGEPTRIANEMMTLLQLKLNELFATLDISWLAYGNFSRLLILTNYDGPRPTTSGFVPYNGDFEKLDAKPSPSLLNAFRMAMLLDGVDVSGLKGMSMVAHTREDIDQTVDACRAAIKSLRTEGLC